MAELPLETEPLLGVREMLETALDCLDQAKLDRVAVHVEMALNALGKEPPVLVAD